MERYYLRQQLAAMRKAMFDEEMLDNYFDQLESLEDTNDPYFVEVNVTNYYEQSTAKIAEIEKGMREYRLNFGKLDESLNQLKRSSTIIGAKRVRAAVKQTKECIMTRNIEGAKAALQQVKMEHDTLKARLRSYLELRKRVGQPKKDGASSSSKDGEEK